MCCDIKQQQLHRLCSDKQVETGSKEVVPVVQFSTGTTLAVLFDAFIIEGMSEGAAEKSRRVR